MATSSRRSPRFAQVVFLLLSIVSAVGTIWGILRKIVLALERSRAMKWLPHLTIITLGILIGVATIAN
jgi:hypothetical protein